jgi:Tfp pilus assembly protein PilV
MIVAAVLLAIGIAATLGAIASATQATGAASRIERAALLAQQRITELSLQPDALMSGEERGNFAEPNSEFRYIQQVEGTEFQTLFRVTVVVQWGSPDHVQERQYTTYLSRTQNQPAQNDQNSTGNSQNNTGNSSGAGGGNGRR